MVDTQMPAHADEAGAGAAPQDTRCGGWAKSRRWSELSTPGRVGTGVLGTVQLALLVAAQVDIQRRSAREINGSKTVWRLVCLLNFVGPLSYYRWGRRRRAWWQGRLHRSRCGR
jgi:phospholipase D-like protein